VNNNNPQTDAQSKLQAIIDTATDGIITIDIKGSIESINPAGAELFGYKPQELFGKNIHVLMPNPYHREHDQYLRNYLSTGKKKIIGIGREVKGLRKDGSIFPLRLSVAEVQLNDKKIFTGMIHDISDKVLAEEAQEALEREKELNVLKSRFISTASHEFRTPLTSILSSATLIGKYDKTESQGKRLKHVDRIQRSVRNLNNILNDFLSISKLEEGKVKHHPLSFNLKEAIEESIEELEAMTKTNQKIVYQHFTTDHQVFLDKKLLHNVLINLLSNAIKYSNEGQQIDIRSAVSKEDIMIEVQDYGIGIPHKAQVHLFERFFRADNVVNIQGTGLGLNIIKRYLQLMGGSVTFDSELNKGTTFRIEFPT